MWAQAIVMNCGLIYHHAGFTIPFSKVYSLVSLEPNDLSISFVPQVGVILRQRFFSRDAEVQKLERNDHMGLSLLGLLLYAEQSFLEVLSFTNQRRLVHSSIHIQGYHLEGAFTNMSFPSGV
jgi:hypothetical protein